MVIKELGMVKKIKSKNYSRELIKWLFGYLYGNYIWNNMLTYHIKCVIHHFISLKKADWHL